MEDKIERYYYLKQKEKELKEEMEKLNREIKNWMIKENGGGKVEINGYKIHVGEIDFRKFTDDIIPFLKINGFSDLVETKEVFDYEKLKKLIKKGMINKGSIERYRSDKGKKSINLYVTKTKNV